MTFGKAQQGKPTQLGGVKRGKPERRARSWPQAKRGNTRIGESKNRTSLTGGPGRTQLHLENKNPQTPKPGDGPKQWGPRAGGKYNTKLTCACPEVGGDGGKIGVSKKEKPGRSPVKKKEATGPMGQKDRKQPKTGGSR